MENHIHSRPYTFVFQSNLLMEKLLILLPIGLLTTVQLLLKWQATTHGSARSSLWAYFIGLGTSVWMWCAIVLAGLSFMAWMLVLKRVPLSFAYPFVSLTFPLVVIGSVAIFGEKVNTPQLIGLGLIIVGISLHVRYAHIQ
jgi:multidrug transporter EmrE-like cation transporter